MDVNLVKRAKKGDDNAFVELMEQNKLALYKAAKAILNNEEDIADAMQETLLSAYKNIGKLKNEKYFKTWLTRILINKCNDIISANKKTISTEFTAEIAYEDATLKDTTEDIFYNVRAEYKVVLNLYYVLEFSVKEIAQILNIKEGTVKSRLSRGRAVVKRNYNNELREAL